MVPLLEVLQRRRARDRFRDAKLDARSRRQPVENRIVCAQRAMETMERIDEHPHRHAAGSRRGQRRLHGTPDIIVERHVDLQVDAPLARFDRRQQPAPRLLVVQFHLDAIAGDRLAGGGHIEPRGYGCGNGESAVGRRSERGDLIRANRGKSCRRRLMRPVVDDGDDGKSVAAHPRRGAGEPHRVHLRRHVERLSLSEHRAGIDDIGRKAGGAQFRAQRRAAPDRTHAHANRLRPRRPANQRQLVRVEFGVEQDEILRAARRTATRVSTDARASGVSFP